MTGPAKPHIARRCAIFLREKSWLPTQSRITPEWAWLHRRDNPCPLRRGFSGSLGSPMTRITDNASRRFRASGMNEVVSQDQDRSLPDRTKDGGETPVEPGARVPTQSESFLSVSDFEAEARRRLDPAVFDYIAGGAEEEITVRENEAAFARIGLLPRVLRGGDGKPQIGISLLDCPASLPVM